MTIGDYGGSLGRHYAQGDLRQRVMDALKAAGVNPNGLRQVDLASLDQFHLGGLGATRELARSAGLGPGMRVVDLGGGYGGPARTLAAEFGCRVDVVDITEEFCRLGELLTELTGLRARVSFHHGSALEPPFPSESFDVCWTQHSTMNISNKERLYREAHRVVRADGRYAFHEVLAGPEGPLRFPVPWAGDASISFLRSPDEVRRALNDAGFEEMEWEDVTQATVAMLSEPRGPMPVAAQIVHPEAIGEMMASVRRNCEEGRTVVVQAVFRRA